MFVACSANDSREMHMWFCGEPEEKKLIWKKWPYVGGKYQDGLNK